MSVVDLDLKYKVKYKVSCTNCRSEMTEDKQDKTPWGTLLGVHLSCKKCKFTILLEICAV